MNDRLDRKNPQADPKHQKSLSAVSFWLFKRLRLQVLASEGKVFLWTWQKLFMKELSKLGKNLPDYLHEVGEGGN